MSVSKKDLELKMADQSALSNLFPEVGNIEGLSSYSWRKQSFHKGDTLFQPGQPCDRFMLLGRGAVRVELKNVQLRSIVLYRIEPGQLCIHSLINLINDEDYNFIATAESDGWFCWADKQQFHTWMESSSHFHQWVLNNIGTRFKQVVDRFAQHAFLPVEARLAGLLIEKMGAEQTVTIKQSELAAELGTAREIVSRYLSRWKKQGVLETRRGEVKIIQIETLVDIAV
ncbi:MAG: Crp/Fnr family transcriptional regulator [Gammaproteobacteria bacterium]|nr:Crp/Fnr family transcriptional regulator [Gammaproteobacteria bacterium]